MFYEERFEDGEWWWRGTPNGEWVRKYGNIAIKPAPLTTDLLRANKELSSLNFDLWADAARYRWLRSEGFEYVRVQDLTCDTSDIGLDQAIDLRIAAKSPEKQA